jgi:hypothetical protein
MSENIKADMRQHFFNEYYESAKDKLPGLLGKLARRHKPKTRGDKVFSYASRALMWAVVLGGVFVAMIGIATPSPLAFVGMGLAFGTVFADYKADEIARKKAKSLAEKDLDRDIASGALSPRYKTEVLDQQLAAARNAEAQVQEKIKAFSAFTDLKPAFTEAANDVQPAAPQRRHLLGRRAQPAKQV